MTENKRFSVKCIMFDGYCIYDAINDKYYDYDKNDLELLCNVLNELQDECEFLKTENEALEHAATKYAELCHKTLKENKQLKAQLYCDSDEGVCIICKHHYLEKGKTHEKYYISKCKKGHEECSKIDLKYCDDFELKEGDV